MEFSCIAICINVDIDNIVQEGELIHGAVPVWRRKFLLASLLLSLLRTSCLLADKTKPEQQQQLQQLQQLQVSKEEIDCLYDNAVMPQALEEQRGY